MFVLYSAVDTLHHRYWRLFFFSLYFLVSLSSPQVKFPKAEVLTNWAPYQKLFAKFPNPKPQPQSPFGTEQFPTVFELFQYTRSPQITLQRTKQTRKQETTPTKPTAPSLSFTEWIAQLEQTPQGLFGVPYYACLLAPHVFARIYPLFSHF